MDKRGHIEDLLARFAWFTDREDADEIGCLYTADAQLSVRSGSYQAKPIQGREAICSFIRSVWRPLDEQRRHVLSNLFMDDLDADETKVTGYLSMFVVQGGDIRIQCTGVYHWIIRAEADGALRIARTQLDLDRPAQIPPFLESLDASMLVDAASNG